MLASPGLPIRTAGHAVPDSVGTLGTKQNGAGGGRRRHRRVNFDLSSDVPKITALIELLNEKTDRRARYQTTSERV